MAACRRENGPGPSRHQSAWRTASDAARRAQGDPRTVAPLNPIPVDQVTGELFRGTVQPFLDRHREQKAAEKIIIDARDYGLPVDARAKPWAKELSQWQMKLLRTIGERLGDGDYPLDTIRVVVKEVVADVTREFEAERAAEQDRELRDEVTGRARYSIPFGPEIGSA